MRSVQMLAIPALFFSSAAYSQQPTELKQTDFKEVSIAPTTKSRSVAVTFSAAQLARERANAGEPMPQRITIGIDGKPTDFEDVTGTGTYTAYIRTLTKPPPMTPVFKTGGIE